MNERLAVLATVIRNGTLRRVELAFLLFSVGEWSTWMAVVVYAYDRGGAAEAGLIAFLQLVPSVVVAPAAATFGDRFPRARLLVATYAVQAASMAAVAVALAGAAPAPLVYVLATVTATAITLTRPIQGALLPEVVDTPDELVAANVGAGTIEGLGTLLGPALTGLLVAIAGPGLVFAVAAVGLSVAAAAVLPTARRLSVARLAPDASTAPDVGEVLAGLSAIRGDDRLLGLAATLFCAMFLLGSLDIFYAVLAFDVLVLGESGVGLLGAATGVGMLAGATAAVGLVGSARLGRPIVVASLAYGGTIALIGLAPAAGAVALLLVGAGTASQFVYITVQTMIQRVTPDAVLSRVFGVFEALMMTATALGALAVPVVIGVVGAPASFVVVGLSLPVVVVLGGRALIRADRTAVLRTTEVRLLRGIPMFAGLSLPVVESLSANLEREVFPAGSTIIREGDRGDRYYLIVEGRVGVDVGGRRVREEGPGDGFGEIALLRDVPRTATVTALDDVVVQSLCRDPFLAALTGAPRARTAAEEVVAERLATAG